MSARNSLAAKAARRADRAGRDAQRTQVRVSVAEQAAAADVVHRAVCTVTQGDGFGHCMLYAWAGAVLLTRITGRLHVPQGGGVSIRTGDVNAQGEAFYVVMPGGGAFTTAAGELMAGGRDNGEFHAWTVQVPGGIPDGARGIVPIPAGQLIIADFAARHFRRAMELSGMRRQERRGLAPVPDWCWGTSADIGAGAGIAYMEDLATTQMVRDHLAAIDAEVVEPLTALTLVLWDGHERGVPVEIDVRDMAELAEGAGMI